MRQAGGCPAVPPLAPDQFRHRAQAVLAERILPPAQPRNLVGLDKLAVEAAFSSATKSFEPRFIAGKTFGERLTVSVSTLVGATSDSSASAEFKLLENVFLVGSWQSATTQKTGDLGADIKFKYRYRTFKDFLGGGD